MNIYFIGIGGISMSSIAIICSRRGHNVSGSDLHNSQILEKMKSMGIEIRIGHTKQDFSDIDLVVYNAAIAADNEELAYARKYNVPCIKRAQLLGNIMSEYPISIAVSGMHGKTTTTAIISQMLMDYDPTVHLGGDFPLIKGNFRLGESSYFVTEACEYKRNFIYLKPYVSVILNIDEDHTDYFKDMEDIQDAFCEFAALTKRDGMIIVNGEDSRTVACAALTMRKYKTFGIGENYDFCARNLISDSMGRYSFDFFKKDKKLCNIALSVIGRHNVYNALASAAVGNFLGISSKKIALSIGKFTGVCRRYEHLGYLNGAQIIADYAHHPKEIEAVLNAAKADNSNIVTVFQPHTYSRTVSLKEGFVQSLSISDEVILLPIYAAREKDQNMISSKELCEQINKKGKKANYFENFESCAQYLKQHITDKDILFIMGAGDIIDLKDYLISGAAKI